MRGLLRTALLCVALAAADLGADEGLDASAALDTTKRMPVVVLPLESASGDPKLVHWGAGHSWLLGYRLENARGLRILPPIAVVNGLLGLEIAGGKDLDPAARRRLGTRLEARRVISGSFRRDVDQWVLRADITSVASVAAPTRLEVRGKTPLDANEKLALAIVDALGVKLSDAERVAVTRAPTKSAEAFEEFVLGLREARSSEEASALARHIQRAFELDSEFGAAGMRLAIALTQSGQLEPAMRLAQHLALLRPDEPEALEVVGHLHLRRNEPDKAIAVWERACALRPDDTDIHQLLGQMYLQRGELQRARESFETSVALDPTSATVRLLLARTYVGLRDRERAVAAVDGALRRAAGNPDILRNAADARRTLGDVPGAIEVLERLLLALRAGKADGKIVAQFEQQASALRQSLQPRTVDAPRPRSYTDEELEAELRKRLDESELAVIERPLRSNEAMRGWAKELTAKASTDMEKARAIFDGLTRRIHARSSASTRTAEEVFAAWTQPAEHFNCQEYSKLYLALARAVGLESYYVHLERDYRGKVVYHDCAAVFIDDRALLVDPSYSWFGVRHVSFEIHDDLETVAHQLLQSSRPPGNIARARIALKLTPDSVWGKLRLASYLLAGGELKEATSWVVEAGSAEPNRWDLLEMHGRLAMKAGESRLAEEYFRSALVTFPEGSALRFGLGAALVEQGRLIEARQHLRTAVAHAENDARRDAALQGIAQIDEKISSLTEPEVAGLLEKRREARSRREIGIYGEPSRVVIIGAKAFSPRQIGGQLRLTPAAMSALHPRASRREALEMIESQTHKGYLAAGFPRVQVTAAIDTERQRLVVRVDEGDRVRAGPVRVEGNSEVTTEQIIADLCEPKTKPDGDATDPFWDPSGAAKFGETGIERGVDRIRRLYGKHGFRDARIELAVTELGDGTASLDVKVADEGPRSVLGEVTFLGEHSDDPQVLLEKLELKKGMVAVQGLDGIVGKELEGLGRYWVVRARELPGGRPDVVDLEVYLQGTESAVELSKPRSELEEAISRTVEWLRKPRRWQRDHVITVRNEAIARATDFSFEDVEIRFVLGKDGFGLSVLVSEDADADPESLFDLAFRDGEGWLHLPSLGLRSQFRADFEVRLTLSLVPVPPGSDAKWRLLFGVGGRTSSSAGFRITPALSELGAALMAQRFLESEKKDGRFRITYVSEDWRSPVGEVDPETGELRLDGDIEGDGIDISLKSVVGALASVVDSTRAAADGKTSEHVALEIALARSGTHLAPKAAKLMSGGDEALEVTLRLVFASIFQDEGPAVRVFRKLSTIDFVRETEGEESFVVPMSQRDVEAMVAQPARIFGRIAITYLAPLLAYDSWPRTLLVEAACLASGEGRYTERELTRLLSSLDVGPIGHWVAAEASTAGGLDVFARRFAERALGECSTEGFRREVALLEKIAPGALADVGEGLKTASDEDVKRILDGTKSDDRAGRLRDLLENRATSGAKELGAAVLDLIFQRMLEPLIRARVEATWPGLTGR